MSKQIILLVGATGETGTSILDALVKDASFDVRCFVRRSSLSKPGAQALVARGLELIVGDLDDPTEDLVHVLTEVNVIISCLSPAALPLQTNLMHAASQLSSLTRFVPCAFGTPSARGLSALRDAKEAQHDLLFRLKLPFTVLDLGFWYQGSIPRVSNGRFDKAIFMPANRVYGAGTQKNMLIDLRDVGPVVVQILKDERSINKRIVAFGDSLSQNEIQDLIEGKTGEELELIHISDEKAYKDLEDAQKALKLDPANRRNRFALAAAQYAITKYIRGDNTLENAEYLGYLNAGTLYPNLQLRTFAAFIDELVRGEIERPYPDVLMGP